MKTLPRNLFIASIVLFLISQALSASWCKAKAISGIILFLRGPLGLYAEEAIAASWLVNPLLVVAWITFRKNAVISFALSVLAFIIAVSSLELGKIPPIPEIMGIWTVVVYWVWLASTVVMMVGTGIQVMEERKK